MSTKRRKGRFGPEDRKARMILFIDDLNMPAKEKYMAQPPLEIIRQQIDQGGWYDLETKVWKYLEDITFLAAMGPPSQGRNTVSVRCSRHFNVLYIEPQSHSTLTRIFSHFMDFFFMKNGLGLPSMVKNLQAKTVSATILIYNKIKSSQQLLPIPAKSHYVYNLRDITKVFYGIGRVGFFKYYYF